MLKLLKSKRGEGYIDVCVLVLCAMLVIALAVQVLPVFIAKNQLDTYATELCRTTSPSLETCGTEAHQVACHFPLPAVEAVPLGKAV